MRKNIFYTIFCALVMLGACKRDDFWNQTTEVNRGTISGTLTNTDDNSVFKGVKILFERQTKGDGSRTFVDTVATDAQGNFKYEVPYPNKVKVSIRDTGRYHLDETYVELTEKKDYPISLKSFPRFGESSIETQLLNELDQPMKDLQIDLYVKGEKSDSYSFHNTLHTDNEGKVVFDKIAFPVYYKVVFVDNPNAYVLDSVESRLLTKDRAFEVLKTKTMFGVGNLELQSLNHYLGKFLSGEKVNMQFKSIKDYEFGDKKEYTLDANGKIRFENFVYPAEVKITSLTNAAFPFNSVTLVINETNIVQPILFSVFDSSPRYADLTPSGSVNDNTLEVFYVGDQVLTMEHDSKSNVYATTSAGELVKYTIKGERTIIATGFTEPWGIAIQDDNTFYISENTGGHAISKVVLDPVTGSASVSLFAGARGTTGTADGDLLSARFNRPGDLVYDKSRNSLWIGEWANNRIRKIDLNNSKVSTYKTGIGFYFGISLTADSKYLYLASHTNNAGIYKYDIDADKLYVVKTGLGSTRHVAVAPNDRVYFTTNAGASVRRFETETLVEATGNGTSNSGGSVSVVAGSVNTKGGDNAILAPRAGYKGPANIPLFEASDAGAIGIMYDPFTGRLYVASRANRNLYFIKLSSTY